MQSMSSKFFRQWRLAYQVLRQRGLKGLSGVVSRVWTLFGWRGLLVLAFPNLSISQPKSVQFTCNLCGEPVTAPLEHVRGRETLSCLICGSTLRKRSIILVLSQRLFDRPLTLPEFPHKPQTTGMGMTDCPSYAMKLSQVFDYTNTFLHREPRLDITSIPNDWKNHFDFIVSSDVFEHVPPPVECSFQNTFQLLKPGGVLILTVPYKKHGSTEEHFPDLYDYQIEKREGTYVLMNTTRHGEYQEFTDLCFHGGPGSTLEMRVFSEQHLESLLLQAGFEDIRFHKEEFPRFGVDWAQLETCFPISARKPG